MAKRRFLKLDNQTYRLQGETLRIPIKPRQFLTLKLKIGSYQRRFLEDSSLKLGSVTLTESKVIAAFQNTRQAVAVCNSVVAYDTNELSLDGAFWNRLEIKPIHVDLREVARLRTIFFERRRHQQRRLAHCVRKLRVKLATDRDRERRCVDAVLHCVAKKQVNFAKENNARILLEDLNGVRRRVNRRMRRRNPYNSKIQAISGHSKSLKRRLNSWPFRRLHAFIEYKAKWEGIELSYVPAENTSRTCARCGCLQTERNGERDPNSRQVFQCPRCGWTCDRHLNAALNLLRAQDEGRWFSPDRLPNEVMTASSEPTGRKLSHERLTEPGAVRADNIHPGSSPR